MLAVVSGLHDIRWQFGNDAQHSGQAPTALAEPMTAHPAAQTYWSLVETAARAHPDRVILVDDYGRTLSCGQLCESALTCAAALAQRGIGAGTVVSWQLPTTLETMVVMVALARLGA